MYLERKFMWLGALLRPFIGKIPLLSFNPEFLGENLVYHDYLRHDPLEYRGKMRLTTCLEMTNAGTKIRNHPEKLQTPYMIIHGTQDQIVFFKFDIKKACPYKVEKFVNKTPIKDKYLIPIDGGQHDLWMDKNYMDLFAKEIAKWIINRSS